MLVTYSVATISVSGTRLKRVTCEKCRTVFWYRLTRTSFGRAVTPGPLVDSILTEPARKQADQKLQKRLDRECELTPCPKCNWVNESAIAFYRKRQYRSGYWWCLTSAGIGAFIFFSVEAMWDFRFSPAYIEDQMILGAITFVFVIGFPALLLAIQEIRRRQFNPNVRYPRFPELPPLTPPAMLAYRDAASGKANLRVVKPSQPGNGANLTNNMERGWALLRRGNLQLPQCCCVCLAPASYMYRQPMTPSKIFM